jgi:cysteine synthase
LVAPELGHGKRVLAILPDTGERYLSTELWS